MTTKFQGRMCVGCGMTEVQVADATGDTGCTEDENSWVKVHVWGDPADPTFSWDDAMAGHIGECSECGASVTNKVAHVQFHRRVKALEAHLESVEWQKVIEDDRRMNE